MIWIPPEQEQVLYTVESVVHGFVLVGPVVKVTFLKCLTRVMLYHIRVHK